MKPENPITSPLPAAENKPHKNKALPLLAVVIIFGLIGGAFYIGKSMQTNAVNTQSTTVQESNSTKFIDSYGFPFDLKAKKKITIRLGLPKSFEAVAIRSDNSIRGIETKLTDKFNDEIGRWIIGYPDFRSSNINDISIVTISDSWLEASQSEVSLFDGLESDIPLNTPSEKTKFVEDLKTKTQICAKDGSKGFQTEDKIFSICFDMTYGREEFRPFMSLIGFAEIAGEPFVLMGGVEILDGNPNATNNTKDEIVPESTRLLLNEFKNSLSKTKTIVEDNINAN